MPWHVITLNEKAFGRECLRLQGLVEADGFIPDVVLGIRTGGEWVARKMFPAVPHVYTRVQRSSTAPKSVFEPLLKRLPVKILDFMRIAEARWLSIFPRRQVWRVVKLPELPTRGTILIVDDAVDSGATLLSVRNTVAEVCPELEIRTAAITQTTEHPDIVPDYALYRNNTLIRFPWSKDARR